MTIAVAGVLCFVTFYAKGGLNLELMTTVEMALTLGAGLLVAAVAILARDGGRGYGLWSVGLLIVFTLLTAVSVIWSVSPGASWQDTGRMLAYSGVFAASASLVRLAPDRWPAILGGVTLAAVTVCAYALLTKVFPATLAPTNTHARLGGTVRVLERDRSHRRDGIDRLRSGSARGCDGHALCGAMAYPATGGTAVDARARLLARGAGRARGRACCSWFCAARSRLRGAAVLILGAVAAGARWPPGTSTLGAQLRKESRSPNGSAPGICFGALLLAMVLALDARRDRDRLLLPTAARRR